MLKTARKSMSSENVTLCVCNHRKQVNFHVMECMRTSAKCLKMKNAHAKLLIMQICDALVANEVVVA